MIIPVKCFTCGKVVGGNSSQSREEVASARPTVKAEDWCTKHCDKHA